jgi:predicted dehydrogenase
LWSMRTGGDYFDSYKAEWIHFGAAIRNRTSIGATVDDGRRSLEVVLAAAQSINTGRPIKVTDAPRELPRALREDRVKAVATA